MKLLLYLLILQILFKPGDSSAFECSCDVGIIQENTEDLKSNMTVLTSQIEHMQTKMDRLESKLTSVLVAVESLAGKRNYSLCQNSTDWIFYEGSCYLFPPYMLPFLEAEEFCNSRDGHLVHIDNKQENTFIRDLLQSLEVPGAWIGLSDMEKEEEWTWYGTDKEASYLNWADGEPNNYQNQNEDCAYMYGLVPIGVWNDRQCYPLERFVCEK